MAMAEQLTAAPTSGAPRLLVTGDLVGLGGLRAELVETYWGWEQDSAVLAGFGQIAPGTLQERQLAFEAATRARDTEAHFTIYLLDADAGPVPIGVSSLFVRVPGVTAEFQILLGAHRGKGLGGEATRLTVDWAFHMMHMRSVYLTVREHNVAAIKAYEHAGFQHAGRRRNAAMWLGSVCDELLMDIVPDELSTSVLHPGKSPISR